MNFLVALLVIDVFVIWMNGFIIGGALFSILYFPVIVMSKIMIDWVIEKDLTNKE